MTLPKLIVPVTGRPPDLKITGVIYKGNNRYIHESVYAEAGGMKKFQSLLKARGWPLHILAYNLRSPFMTECGARVAFIHRQYRANIAAVYNHIATDGNSIPIPFAEDDVTLPSGCPSLSDDQRARCLKLLRALFNCTPNQGVGNNLDSEKKEEDRSWQRRCEQYALCPWCRYEKALHVFDVLAPHLAAGKEVAVTHFKTPCDSQALDLNSDPAVYNKVIRSLCKEKKTWEKDYVITLPERVETSAWQDGEPDAYELFWKTSVIALVEKGGELLAPENAVSKNIEGCTFISDGLWHRFPATKEGLGQAFKLIMPYPKFMLGFKHDDRFVHDVLTVLLADDRDRAVGHGFPPGSWPTRKKKR